MTKTPELTPEDDDEFARYLASWLKDREDYFLVTNKWHDTEVNQELLEASIKKFINDLP